MAKKLTEDEIKMIISVDASKAQQEIHQLSEANKDLSKEMGKVSEEMKRFRTRESRQSDEYLKLQKEHEALGKTMEANSKKIADLNKSMSVNDLTMNQLRDRASSLRKQLADTSMATDPKRFHALRKELEEVRNRMRQVEAGTADMKESFCDNLSKMVKSTALWTNVFRDALFIII